jgi:hypothetical protein
MGPANRAHPLGTSAPDDQACFFAERFWAERFWAERFCAERFISDFFSTPAAAVAALAGSAFAALGWILFSAIMPSLARAPVGACRCRHHRAVRSSLAVLAVTDLHVSSATTIA